MRGRLVERWDECEGQIARMITNECFDSDTGEHISNDKNELEYIPFPICDETGKPLELQYGMEDGKKMRPLRVYPY